MTDIEIEYRRLTSLCANTDFENKKSLARHNNAVGEMYEIIEKVRRDSTGLGVKMLGNLLDVNEDKTNLWLAAQMLEKLELDNSTTEKALKIIENAAKGDSAEALGFQMWLTEFKNKKQSTTKPKAN